MTTNYSGRMPRGFLNSSAVSSLCSIEPYPFVCKIMIKTTLKFVTVSKKCNYVTVTVTKKKYNAITSKVTKKVTCNCNFVSNELLLFFDSISRYIKGKYIVTFSHICRKYLFVIYSCYSLNFFIHSKIHSKRVKNIATIEKEGKIRTLE